MINITLYQIVVAIVACFIITSRTLRFFKKESAQSPLKYLAVIFIWGLIGSVALFPQIAHWIRKTFGFGENFNTMIFIAFVILFVLIFRLLSIIERIEKTITEFVRKEALRGFDRKRESDTRRKNRK